MLDHITTFEHEVDGNEMGKIEEIIVIQTILSVLLEILVAQDCLVEDIRP